MTHLFATAINTSTKRLAFVLAGSGILISAAIGTPAKAGMFGDCSMNQTAQGAVVGGAVGAGIGASVSRNSGRGAILGGMLGGLVGAAIGNRADQECRDQAEQAALDAAVARYQEEERRLAEQQAEAAREEAAREAAAQEAAQEEEAREEKAREAGKHVAAKPKPKVHKPVAVAATTSHAEPKYDTITWTAQSSGDSGSITPQHVDVSDNNICVSHNETRDDNGKQTTQSVKSCRQANGKWKDVA